MTEEAIFLLNAGADPNGVNAEGLPLISTAISCGNADFLRELLQRGANISTGDFLHGPGIINRNPRGIFVITITTLLLILQFYQPPKILELFRFAILTVPVEQLLFTITMNNNRTLLHPYVGLTIALLYFTLHLTSLYGFAGRSLVQGFAILCLRSRSIWAYGFRRILLSVVVSWLNNFIPTDPEVPPGIAALCALYEHIGQAEDMCLLLLRHGLDLGEPKGGDDNFSALWYWAVWRGYAEVVRILIRKGPPVSLLDLELLDPEDSDGTRPPIHILKYVAKRGHVELVRVLLEEAPQYAPELYKREQLTDAMMTCLIQHAIIGNDTTIALATLLLNHGADANATSNEGQSALSWACDLSIRYELVKLLLEKGAAQTINSTNENGWTVLHHLSWVRSSNVREALTCLLEAGADINALDDFGHTPLWWAACSGEGEDIAIFLENGAEVDLRGEYRRDGPGGSIGDISTTPLIEACHRSATESCFTKIAVLLAYGADVNAFATDRTPLTSVFSIQYMAQREDLVYMLLQAGAHPVMPPSFPTQPLIESVRCTAEAGEWMFEILSAARSFTHGKIPQAVLDGAVKKMLQRTPWIYLDGLIALIAEGGSASIQTEIADAKGDISTTTPLHCVAKAHPNHRGRTADTIRFLLENGSLITAQDDAGRTALHQAVEAINRPAFNELIAQGADLDSRDSMGCSPLSLACQTLPTQWDRYKSSDPGADDLFDGDRLERSRDVTLVGMLNIARKSAILEEMIHALRGFGANIANQDNQGLMPLHHACRTGNSITAGVLLLNRRHFQTPNHSEFRYSMRDLLSAEDDKGKTPLHWAAHSGDSELVRMILSANLLRLFDDGEETLEADKLCPLHLAFDSGLVHARDDAARTPLYYAVEAGHVDVVRIFLEDVEVMAGMVPDDRASLITLAEGQGDEEISAMLHSEPRPNFVTVEDCQKRCRSSQAETLGRQSRALDTERHCIWCRCSDEWMKA